jgi:hypothetical protein
MSSKPIDKAPPCSKWKIWTGLEIEGHHDRGEKTLFIRTLPADVKLTSDLSFMKKCGATRVWLCKELLLWAANESKWPILRKILDLFPKACIETTPGFHTCIPEDVRNRCRVYLKITNVTLKPGDQVCVGPSFEDEAFESGKGVKVVPASYLNDVRIL